MQHITGIHRNQITIAILEDTIYPDNPIQLKIAFLEKIDLKATGFQVQTLKTEGRPSFDTKIFLKLYLYGYLNVLRSSRKLENGFSTLMSVLQKWQLTPNSGFSPAWPAYLVSWR